MLLTSQKVSLLAPDFISVASDVLIRHRSSGVEVIRSAERLLLLYQLCSTPSRKQGQRNHLASVFPGR